MILIMMYFFNKAPRQHPSTHSEVPTSEMQATLRCAKRRPGSSAAGLPIPPCATIKFMASNDDIMSHPYIYPGLSRHLLHAADCPGHFRLKMENKTPFPPQRKSIAVWLLGREATTKPGGRSPCHSACAWAHQMPGASSAFL